MERGGKKKIRYCYFKNVKDILLCYVPWLYVPSIQIYIYIYIYTQIFREIILYHASEHRHKLIDINIRMYVVDDLM